MNTVSIWGLIPIAIKNTFQKFDVNCESRSESMSVGILGNLHISWAKASVDSVLFFFVLKRDNVGHIGKVVYNDPKLVTAITQRKVCNEIHCNG
jgi:hypothetical protein